MPTPSAPDPQSPYTFISTCPEPDERHDTLLNDTAHRNLPPNPFVLPPSEPRDGPVLDADPMSSPLSDATRGAAVSYHKPIDDAELERSQSPYGSSPIEPVQTSRPRQGVGTASLLSTGESVVQDPGSEYAMEEDYGLPSMGFGLPNRRVRLRFQTLAEGTTRVLLAQRGRR